MERELEHQLRRRRNAEFPARKRGQDLKVLLQRLKDLVRIELEIAHHLGERVPLDLREREKYVFVGQQRVITPPRFLDGAVNDALSRLTNLALCDVEVVHGTCFLRNTASPDATRVPEDLSSQFLGRLGGTKRADWDSTVLVRKAGQCKCLCASDYARWRAADSKRRQLTRVDDN